MEAKRSELNCRVEAQPACSRTSVGSLEELLLDSEEEEEVELEKVLEDSEEDELLDSGRELSEVDDVVLESRASEELVVDSDVLSLKDMSDDEDVSSEVLVGT